MSLKIQMNFACDVCNFVLTSERAGIPEEEYSQHLMLTKGWGFEPATRENGYAERYLCPACNAKRIKPDAIESATIDALNAQYLDLMHDYALYVDVTLDKVVDKYTVSLTNEHDAELLKEILETVRVRDLNEYVDFFQQHDFSKVETIANDYDLDDVEDAMQLVNEYGEREIREWMDEKEKYEALRELDLSELLNDVTSARDDINEARTRLNDVVKQLGDVL